jgi:hypothetical protein
MLCLSSLLYADSSAGITPHFSSAFLHFLSFSYFILSLSSLFYASALRSST